MKEEEVVKEDGVVLKVEEVKEEVVIKDEVVNELLDFYDVLFLLGVVVGFGEVGVNG